MGAPLWAWVAFLLFVVAMVALDLFLQERQQRRHPALWSAIWVGLSLLFAGALWLTAGPVAAEQFLTGWLVEKALAVDNVFFFVVAFSTLGVAVDQRQRVLVWGVLAALVLRGAMIAAGSALLERFGWMIFLFGGVLVFTGVSMLRPGERGPSLDRGALAWLQRHLPMARNPPPDRFFVVEDGALKATKLLLALVFIELTDLVFAIDSVPAIFSITRDPFLVYTSNIFALLGLRSLYFLLESASRRLPLLEVGLAGVLLYVGGTMVASPWVHVHPLVSLNVVVCILGVSALLSLRKRHQAATKAAEPLR
jgi:tellurite resistance protein TerC